MIVPVKNSRKIAFLLGCNETKLCRSHSLTGGQWKKAYVSITYFGCDYAANDLLYGG